MVQTLKQIKGSNYTHYEVELIGDEVTKNKTISDLLTYALQHEAIVHFKSEGVLWGKSSKAYVTLHGGRCNMEEAVKSFKQFYGDEKPAGTKVLTVITMWGLFVAAMGAISYVSSFF